MRKVNWHEVLVFTLRLITRFILVTAFALIILYVFFRGTKVFDYMLSKEAPAGVFCFVVVTYILGFFCGLIFFVANLFYVLTQKDEEIEKLQKENAKLKRKITRISKRHASSFADRVFGEIGSYDDTQTPSNATLEDDFKSLQKMFQEKENTSAKNQ